MNMKAEAPYSPIPKEMGDEGPVVELPSATITNIKRHIVIGYQGEGFDSENPTDAYGPFESEVTARVWATANASTIGQWLVVPLYSENERK